MVQKKAGTGSRGRARLENGTGENPRAEGQPGAWEQRWHEGKGLRDRKVEAVWESSGTGPRHGPDRRREGTLGWRDTQMSLPEKVGWVSSEREESQGKARLELQCRTNKQKWN